MLAYGVECPCQIRRLTNIYKCTRAQLEHGKSLQKPNNIMYERVCTQYGHPSGQSQSLVDLHTFYYIIESFYLTTISNLQTPITMTRATIFRLFEANNTLPHSGHGKGVIVKCLL